jgi:hypothetical protein
VSPRVLRGARASTPVLLHPEKVDGFDPNGWSISIAPERGEIAVRLEEGDELRAVGAEPRFWSTWLVGPVADVLAEIDKRERFDVLDAMRARVA